MMQRAVLTVSLLRQSCLVCASVTSALDEVSYKRNVLYKQWRTEDGVIGG